MTFKVYWPLECFDYFLFIPIYKLFLPQLLSPFYPHQVFPTSSICHPHDLLFFGNVCVTMDLNLSTEAWWQYNSGHTTKGNSPSLPESFSCLQFTREAQGPKSPSLIHTYLSVGPFLYCPSADNHSYYDNMVAMAVPKPEHAILQPFSLSFR